MLFDTIGFKHTLEFNTYFDLGAYILPGLSTCNRHACYLMCGLSVSSRTSRLLSSHHL